MTWIMVRSRSRPETLRVAIAPALRDVDPPAGAGARLKSRLFLAGGTACVCLGAAGVVLPLLPTTPFLLLAAYLLARSSPAHHQRLLSHRLLGPYLADWLDGRGVQRSTKARALAVLWAVLLPTSIALRETVPGALLPLVGGAVTLWVLGLPARAAGGDDPAGGTPPEPG